MKGGHLDSWIPRGDMDYASEQEPESEEDNDNETNLMVIDCDCDYFGLKKHTIRAADRLFVLESSALYVALIEAIVTIYVKLCSAGTLVLYKYSILKPARCLDK